MPIPLHWHTEPLLLLTILGAIWAYAVLTGPMRQKIAPGIPYPTAKAVLFYSGIVLGYLTVGSPIDQLGEDYLFSVHMIQHMMLVYLVPPLLLLGTPGWLADWALTPCLTRKAWKFLSNPVVAGFSFTLIYTAWHIPVLYESALHTKWIHVLEHWTMFLPALFIWWGIASPSRIVPPLPYGVRMLYVFLLMVGQLPVFGFLTLSEEILYPTYEFAPRIFPIGPLEDQILGGVIMKVTNMVVSMLLLAFCFYRWYQTDMAQSARTQDTAHSVSRTVQSRA